MKFKIVFVHLPNKKSFLSEELLIRTIERCIAIALKLGGF